MFARALKQAYHYTVDGNSSVCLDGRFQSLCTTGIAFYHISVLYLICSRKHKSPVSYKQIQIAESTTIICSSYSTLKK